MSYSKLSLFKGSNFMVSDVSTLISTFRYWFRRFGISPRGWRVGSPQASATAHAAQEDSPNLTSEVNQHWNFQIF